MSVRMLDSLMGRLPELRHEPARKRVRAVLGERTVVDTRRAVLVWEPLRVVPSYAVPVEEVCGELVPAPAAVSASAPDHQRIAGHAILDPSVPFAAHTAAGEPLSLRVGGRTLEGVAFRLADPDLEGHVILDFDAFDAWYEEDERLVAHPRDPFQRIDILPSSREVRIERDGELLAQSSRTLVVLEGSLLPARHYMPREDVRVPLRPSDRRSRCAYKGEASYWRPEANGAGPLPELAWSYEAPLREAAALAGLVAFFDEHVDVIVDGEVQTRPETPWA
jgi:uncharacterized protein (DUF427 family)